MNTIVTVESRAFKQSRFNLIVREAADFVVIYNTLQDSLTKVTRDISMLSVVDLKTLHSQGVLVNEGMDELEVYRYRNMQHKMRGKRLHLFITLTGVCNCACKYCFAHDCYQGATVKSSDVPIIVRFISEQLESHASTHLNVDFFGGEPLLCEDVFVMLLQEISDLSLKRGIKPKFQVYTNGTIRLWHNFAELAKTYDITYLVTLDGPKAFHDSQRPLKNGDSCYDKIVENLIEMRDGGAKATIRINFGKRGYVNIPALLDEIVHHGLTEFPIELYPIQNMSTSSAEFDDAVSCGNLAEILPFLWDEMDKRHIPYSTRPRSACCYCTAFTNSMFVIDPSLNVYKCALLQCNTKYRIGNLKTATEYERDSTFYDWLNYDASREFGCKDCVSLPVCSGGCGGSGTFRYGTHHHANCYELSPGVLKLRMERYVRQRFEEQVQSWNKVLILERARYARP